MFMKQAAFVLAILLVTTMVASAQMQAPMPGPEIKKMDFLAGNWTSEVELKPGPWGQGGKFTSHDHYEWMDGGFFLVGHSDYKMPAEMGGSRSELVVMGYDPDERVYTYNSFNSAGEHAVSKGTLADDTWTWTSTEKHGGMTINTRFTLKTLSPTSYSIKLEVSQDGTNWMLFMEGKSTKAK